MVECIVCRTEVEVCAFCEEDGCRKPICQGCLLLAVGQAVPQPHEHGG